MSTTRRITDLLGEWKKGDAEALGELIALISPELRALAERHLRSERSDHTLQATALVNEAYLRLVDAEIDWQDRIHFLAVAGQTMRRVLVDYARARAAAKRGGGARAVTLEDRDGAAGGPAIDLLDLDRAMTALEESDPRKARVVELHYFAGLTHPEIAEAVGVSAATVDRDLRFSRAWLKSRLVG